MPTTPDLPSPLVTALQIAPALAPSGVFLRGEDGLRVRSFNSAAGVALAIEGRQLVIGRGMQAFGERHVPNTDRTVATSLHNLGEGWLTELVVRASAGTPRVGQCFVIVELVRGGGGGGITPLGVLFQGYVTDTSRVGWPGSPIRSSIDGPGVVRSITGTDPAAGSEISETVPANARWRLMGGIFQLVTDATVANRNVRLLIDDGANELLRFDGLSNHAASETRRYVFAGTGYAGHSGIGANSLPFPPWLWLMGGFRIRTTTNDLQAGDNYGAPQLLVEEWIED